MKFKFAVIFAAVAALLFAFADQAYSQYGEYVVRVFLQPETKVKSARYALTLSITKPDF